MIKYLKYPIRRLKHNEQKSQTATNSQYMRLRLYIGSDSDHYAYIGKNKINISSSSIYCKRTC